MTTPRRPASGVTLRAVLTGAVLMAVICHLGPWAILEVKGSQLTNTAIPIIAVLFLFAMTAVAVPVLGALHRRLAFSRSEVITVYGMMLVGSTIVTGFTGHFLSVITGAMYYASPENDWRALFVEHQHPWVTPTDPEAVQYLYEGLPQGMAVPWSAWALTLAVWMPFMAALYWVVLCLAVLLRGQWIDNERLLFPLTSLPLAMTQDPGKSSSLFSPLLRSRLMWLGFAVPLLLHSWNSLSAYHDGIQPLALTGSFSLLQGQVWVPFRLNLPIIGVGYLMSLGVSFSVWFFFVLGLVQTWVFTRVGLDIGAGDVWNSGGGPAAIMHQQAGALVVLVGFVLWTARRHLAGLVRRALDHGGGGGEVMAPRTALLGLPAGVAVVVAWLVLTGLSLFVAVLLVLGALIVYIGVARVICEAGLPGVQTPMVPQAFITRGFGPGVLGLGNMTGLGLSTVWVGAGGLTTMTSAMLHTFKLKATAGERPDRRLPWIFLAAIVVGMAGSIWVTMGISYAHGGINLHGWFFEGAPRWPLRYMASVYNDPESSFSPRMLFTGLGGGFMGLLLFLRQRLPWWPLHPIGYPIATTYPIVSYDWFALFLAWVLKGLALRHGGVRTYRSLLPFFLGLILGEFSTACLWVFIDGAHGVEGNMIFNF